MAYEDFQYGRPDGDNDSGPETLSAIRRNLLAVLDSVAASGVPPCGWNMEAQDSDGTYPPSTPSTPDQAVLTDGQQHLRVEFSWNNGRLASWTAYRSYDGGSTWEPIGTRTKTYHSTGPVIASGWTWS